MASVNIKTFTLGELAKLALGTDKLTNDHVSVLQSLLIILLQKLNCQHESVSIKGFSARGVQKLLSEHSTIKQYDFQLETVKMFKKKYKLLAELEEKVEEMKLKLQLHYNKIRKRFKSDEYSSTTWDFYASPTEDLCTLHMRRNRDLCLLVRSHVFNTDILRHLLPPIFEKFSEFEAKLENMQGMLRNITQMSDRCAKKLSCVQNLINDVESVRNLLSSDFEIFRETMEETQEMLNCKLHRSTLMAITKYLQQHFADVHEQIRILLIESKKCAPVKPLQVKDKSVCLSCARHQEFCLYASPQRLSLLVEQQCFCGSALEEPSILEKISLESYIRKHDKETQLRIQQYGIPTLYSPSYSKIVTKPKKALFLRTAMKRSTKSIAGPEKSISSTIFSQTKIPKLNSVPTGSTQTS